MLRSTIRSIVTALATALVLMPTVPAFAQQAKCLAAKTACMSKKATGLLKCEALAETPGKPADPNTEDCTTKVRAKFDGGTDPTKGCFEKLEGKSRNDCLTQNDTAAAETAVDTCVGSLVSAIDPPPLDQTKCGAGKKKCAAKYLAALLKCTQLAQTPGKPADPNAKGCVDKAVAKYTGAGDPTKGCFAKLQAKSPNDCQSTSDSGPVKTLVESCTTALTAVVAGPPPTTTTTSTTSTSTTSTAKTSTTTTSTTTKPSTTTTPYILPTFCDQQNPCVNGQTCNFTTHQCEFSCVSVTCVANTQICCQGVGGICCDFATQICNDQQTACASPNCQSGEIYVPFQGICCQTVELCGGSGGYPLECCDPDYRCCNPAVPGDCALNVAHCVPRAPHTGVFCDATHTCGPDFFCDPTLHACVFSCGSATCEFGAQFCCPYGGAQCCGSDTQVCTLQGCVP